MLIDGEPYLMIVGIGMIQLPDSLLFVSTGEIIEYHDYR